MPLLYRIMWEEAGKPRVGTGANELGVREEPPELPIADDGTVRPDTGGMSVSPSMEKLPPHLIPKRLKTLFPGARGSNNKPNLLLWHMGEGLFVFGSVTNDLVFRLDPIDSSAHGFVQPARQMKLNDYQAALAATRDSWICDGWPQVEKTS